MNQWRPSRLEAECVQGDGLLLSFPAIECSPFIGYQLGMLHTFCAFVPACVIGFFLEGHIEHISKCAITNAFFRGTVNTSDSGIACISASNTFAFKEMCSLIVAATALATVVTASV